MFFNLSLDRFFIEYSGSFVVMVIVFGFCGVFLYLVRYVFDKNKWEVFKLIELNEMLIMFCFLGFYGFVNLKFFFVD